MVRARVVPRPVQRALESDDDLDALGDPCRNAGAESRDEITARFPAVHIIPTTSPSTTTTAASTTTTTELAYYWQNPPPRNHGASPEPWYPWAGVPTTRLDSVLRRRPLLPTTSTTPRQSNYCSVLPSCIHIETTLFALLFVSAIIYLLTVVLLGCVAFLAFSALTLLVGRQEHHPACKN